MLRQDTFNDFANLGTDKIIKEFSALYDNPDVLSNEMIKKIGDLYLAQYPRNRGTFISFFNPHDNQSMAEKLQQCHADTPFERWNLLIDVVGTLPNMRGKLANTILHMFVHSFQMPIYTYVLSDARGNLASLPSDLMVVQLRGIANTYYANHFQQELNQLHLGEPVSYPQLK